MAQFTPPDEAHVAHMAYLVGYPIAHSLSPLLHNTIAAVLGKDYAQTLYETRHLDAFVKHIKSSPKFIGCSVTMPYKISIMPHLDELTHEAQVIGAVNTIFLKSNPDATPRYCGTNTDCIGVREAFLQNIPNASDYRGKPGLIVGGGGTSRAAVYALTMFLGCKTIYMINRDKSEVDQVIDAYNAIDFPHTIIYVASPSQAARLPPPGFIVSAVPNFSPVTFEEKTARKAVETFLNMDEKGALLEMCYHPSPHTEIDQLARKAGWQVVIGTEAMIGQGMQQASLWSGVPVDELPRDVARQVVRAAISREK